MPSTLLMALARGRSARTGESCRHALNEIRLLQPGTPPIPPAADMDQAALESDFLEVIGRCPKDRWRPRMRPFGIKSVTPRPDALTVRIAAEFLPDIIRDIAPAWRAEEEKDGEVVSMSGIPGLRALHRRGRTVLTRPGVPGRIVIPVPADRWRKAVMVAAELGRYESGTCSPWFTHPRGWHPAETRWAADWPERYAPDSWQYRNAWLASQILRRLPGLCPAPWPYYHDLWFNRFGDECSIQFEWAFGATHDVVLDRLLDPVFGFSGKIALLEGQTLADCHSGAEYRVNIQYAPQPACSISLRRAVWEPADGDGAAGIEFGQAKRRYRSAVEQKYGYGSAQTRIPAS
jgi:hypothetical protein